MTFRNQLVNGDCVEEMRRLPPQSVNLCIIDPPYFKVKGHYWDNQWNTADNFLSWMDIVLDEVNRVLKPSGSLYLFCYPRMAFEVEAVVRKHFTVLNHLVWEKYNDKGFDGWKQKTRISSLRGFYPNSERIIFAEKGGLGEFLKSRRKAKSLSTIKLAEIAGAHGKVNHGGAVSNWEKGLNTPTEEQYEKIKNILELPERGDLIRTFTLNRDNQYTDVLRFKTVKPYKGKHPTEKPLNLISHLVETSSSKGDLIMDCFAGSGVLATACMQLERDYLLIEKDKDYFDKIHERLCGE